MQLQPTQRHKRGILLILIDRNETSSWNRATLAKSKIKRAREGELEEPGKWMPISDWLQAIYCIIILLFLFVHYGVSGCCHGTRSATVQVTRMITSYQLLRPIMVRNA